MNFVATCLFGLEKLVGEEIDSFGFTRTKTIDGRVYFTAPPEAIAVCNIRLKYAERLLVEVGSFYADTFDKLFEGAKRLPWSDLIGKNDAFPVKGHSVRSKLFSIPDCQKIIKKAVVESLRASYRVSLLPETGVKYQIEFFALNDTFSLMIDTSGDSLHKRGYRALSNAAPLRETLAAAMVTLARMRENVIICDPLCGSGTIAIEAALIATGTAPGINRSFAAEEFGWLKRSVWIEERNRAKGEIHPPITRIFGSDIDPECVALARDNAKKAGVDDCIEFYNADVTDFVSPITNARGTIVTNPPYGERMLDLEKARELYTGMGRAFNKSVPSWQYYIISSDGDFEQYFGSRCDKKRPMYNGMIKCSFYQYFKRPKNNAF